MPLKGTSRAPDSGREPQAASRALAPYWESESLVSLPPGQAAVRAAPTAIEPAATARERNERRSTRTVVMSPSFSDVGDPRTVRAGLWVLRSAHGTPPEHCKKMTTAR